MDAVCDRRIQLSKPMYKILKTAGAWCLYLEHYSLLGSEVHILKHWIIINACIRNNNLKNPVWTYRNCSLLDCMLLVSVTETVNLKCFKIHSVCCLNKKVHLPFHRQKKKKSFQVWLFLWVTELLQPQNWNQWLPSPLEKIRSQLLQLKVL